MWSGWSYCRFTSARRVITNNQGLTGWLSSLFFIHMSKTLLRILAVPNKAVFCISIVMHGILRLSVHFSNSFETLPRAPITTGITLTFLIFHNRVTSLFRSWYFLYADLSGYLSPSIITGDSFRPDLLLVTSDHRLFILELTVGYETNLDVNVNRKREKYSNLIHSLSSAYSSIMFVNLSISSLGIFGLSCSSFIDMCNALDISENHLRFMISKVSNLTIRTTYYIFCRRNKSWNNPELLKF